MKAGNAIAAVVIVGGGWYLLSRGGVLAGTGAAIDEVLGYDPFGPSTATDAARAAALRQPAAGNAPVVQNASFVSSGGLSVIGAGTAGLLPYILGPGLMTGIATAGIGVAVAFLSYELMKQRASMHTNDVRDAWQRQFITIHDALGITPLRPDQTAGSGPGNIEMAEVIFYFDHDANNTLWKAVTKTQDERQFRYAAANVDRFLAAHGIPVQDVA
jgi:hypothetical protein